MRRRMSRGILVALGGAFILWWLIRASVNEARDARSVSRLGQIALAMQSYHFEHGAFPPAITYDSSGTALYSWRVLLLPYMGEEELYRQYRLSEPWNSAANLSFYERYPDLAKLFQCDHGNGGDRNRTNFYRIVGTKNGPEVRNEPISLMVVDCDTIQAHWASPFDHSADKLSDGLLGLSVTDHVNALASDTRLCKVYENSIRFYGSQMDLMRSWLPR